MHLRGCGGAGAPTGVSRADTCCVGGGGRAAHVPQATVDSLEVFPRQQGRLSRHSGASPTCLGSRAASLERGPGSLESVGQNLGAWSLAGQSATEPARAATAHLYLATSSLARQATNPEGGRQWGAQWHGQGSAWHNGGGRGTGALQGSAGWGPAWHFRGSMEVMQQGMPAVSVHIELAQCSTTQRKKRDRH